jgi:hypothetical protein
MKNISVAINTSWVDRLTLNYTTAGTRHGLSKVPYLRDTRRAIGLGGFRLLHAPLRDTNGPTGEHFADTVALGDYNDGAPRLCPDAYFYIHGSTNT